MNTIKLSRFVIILSCLFCLSCKKKETIDKKQIDISGEVYVSDCVPGEHGGAMILSSQSEPKTLNPIATIDMRSMFAQSFILSAIVDYNPYEDIPYPALAKSWDLSEDKLTYTFHLRKGIFWNDGHPFSADDVIFTLDCVLAKKENSNEFKYYSHFLERFLMGDKEVTYKKLDDYTVSVTTPRPYPDFLNNLRDIYVLPKHKLYKNFLDGTLMQTFNLQTAIENPKEIVGTGPYVIQSYRPGEQMILKRNPYYWKVDSLGRRLPYIDLVITQFIGNSTTNAILFSTGKLDACSLKSNDIMLLKDAPAMKDFNITNRGYQNSCIYITFNQNPNKDANGNYFVDPIKLEWFTNKEFRQAIAYAINREKIIQTVYVGNGKSIYSWIADSFKRWYNPNVIKYEYNPEKSRELLKKSGFYWNNEGILFDKKNNRVEFELIYSHMQNEQALTVFQANMLDIGIKVKMSRMEFVSIMDRYSQHKFEAEAGGTGGSPELSSYKDNFRSNGGSHVWFHSQSKPNTEWEKEIDDLYDQQEVEFDYEKRLKLVHKMQYIMSEQMPLIFMISDAHFTGIHKKWQNVKVPPSGSILWNIEEIWGKKQ